MMPARKPTPQKELEGTARRDRMKREAMPAAPVRVPSAPRHLPKDARNLWRRLAPVLIESRLLTKADLPAFEQLCLVYGRRREASALVAKEGAIVEGSKGQPVRHPAISIEAEMSSQIRAYAKEFGLTPASRGGIDITWGLEEKSSLDEFLEDNVATFRRRP